ncbi:DeoR family transcriptional regulator [Virgibacillus tibetensis]|uniref:DeoR family transcriptional regulator n=1 Tax=Virgibacillus tibetensis TaxID=3042313 RepID=UPI002E1806A4
MPADRRKRVEDLIRSHYSMKISDLSKKFNVSEMTIHRDLKPLIDEGVVIKTFGGVTLTRDKQSNETISEECVICKSSINVRMAYRLILQNNKIEMTCCAHCGLIRHRQLDSGVIQAICYDFFRQTTISAHLTWFVMNSSVHIGCCQPQVLTFEWKEHAEKFVKGFGGNVYSFNQATEAVLHKMSGCHSKKNRL